MKSKVVLILVLILIQISLFAQVVFEPLKGNGIYEFLERMSLKGIITSNEFQKQLTRKEIGEYLKAVGSGQGAESIGRLTELEREELEWYKKEIL